MEGNSDLQTYEVYKFNEPEFENELECIGYAQKNYVSITPIPSFCLTRLRKPTQMYSTSCCRPWTMVR